VLFASQTEHNPLILCYNSASSLSTQLTMPCFEVKQSAKSYAGLALIGQCCQAAQVEEVIDPRDEDLGPGQGDGGALGAW
jgi:hypothetical protein